MLACLRTFLLLVLFGCCWPTHGWSTSSLELCNRLPEIENLPLKADGPSVDTVYVKIREVHAELVDCLVDRISDMHVMPDPRSTPGKVSGFRVGDLAFFLLARFGHVGFEEVLPREVHARLPERGVLAYFEWVDKPGNREALQMQVRRALHSH